MPVFYRLRCKKVLDVCTHSYEKMEHADPELGPG